MTFEEHMAEVAEIRAVLERDPQAGLTRLRRALDVWLVDVRALRQEIAASR